MDSGAPSAAATPTDQPVDLDGVERRDGEATVDGLPAVPVILESVTVSDPVATEEVVDCDFFPAHEQGRPDDASPDVGEPPSQGVPAAGSQIMTLETNLGQIRITMDAAIAPCTAASFTHLADQQFYAGTQCHRLVVEGIFLLQCGDPLTADEERQIDWGRGSA